MRKELCVEPVILRREGVDFTVDPRIELLSIIQFLSGSNDLLSITQNIGATDEKMQEEFSFIPGAPIIITKLNFSYREDVVEWFSNHSDHPAVKLFSKMTLQGFTYSTPIQALLYLSQPPDLRLRLPGCPPTSKRSWLTLDPMGMEFSFKAYLKTREGHRYLKSLTTSLRKFCRDTDFTHFFRTHRSTYKQIVRDTAERLADSYRDKLENYFGFKRNSYTMILTSLYGFAGFGARVRRTDSTQDLFCIFGPGSVENNLPVYGGVKAVENFLWRSFIYHEFSHSFINPIVKRYQKQIENYSSLYTPIREVMRKQAYSSWKICVSEHIVRATTARLMKNTISEEAMKKALKKEEQKGFIYISRLYNLLGEYEANRDKYPNFSRFIPTLANLFKSLQETELSEILSDPLRCFPKSSTYLKTDRQICQKEFRFP